MGLGHDLVAIGHEVAMRVLAGAVRRVKVEERTACDGDFGSSVLVCRINAVDQVFVTVSRVAVRLAGEGTAVDDEGTLLDLHSSTAAVIVAVIDGHSSALPDIDAIAAATPVRIAAEVTFRFAIFFEW